MPEFLFAAQVSFSCLNRDVTQEKLDLFQFTTCKMAQTRTCPTKVMGSQVQDSSTPSSGPDDMPYCFWCDSISPDRSLLVRSAKDITLGDFGFDGPFINGSLYPHGHWHRPDVRARSNEVSDYPLSFRICRSSIRMATVSARRSPQPRSTAMDF